jgi:hypothetical protein
MQLITMCISYFNCISAPAQEFLPFSDKVIEAQQKHQQVIDDYEAKKKAKQLVSY